MDGPVAFSIRHILVLFVVIFEPTSVEAEHFVPTCKTSSDKTFSGWDWVVTNEQKETYFINICGHAKCSTRQKNIAICKKTSSGTTENYGLSITGPIPTVKLNGGSGFLVNYTGDEKASCKGKLQTQITFHCDKILGSPELVDDNGCVLNIEFFTKEACEGNKDAVTEIPCVAYNPNDNNKTDLSPLIKVSGGHRVSSEVWGVEMYINVCRDITFDAQVPENACSPGSSSACRTAISKSVGGITKDTKLAYVDGKLKLVYNTSDASRGCPNGVVTEIVFICDREFSAGGTGPVLISNVTASTPVCVYEIIWRTGHACPNNDVITDECKFSNGEVSFDLTKLEKPFKEYSYQVLSKKYEYRIKVCRNGQACGDDVEGKRTAVCQFDNKTGAAVSCGSAKDPSIRYADGVLTLVYKGGKPCSNSIRRRTIITFRCDASVDVGEPTFVEESHCYYYFEWKTRHVCPSRKPGVCSVVSKDGNTYDLSVLTIVDDSPWLALNERSRAAGSIFLINVCAPLPKIKYRECEGAAACEIKNNKATPIGNYINGPDPETLQLVYNAGKCPHIAGKNLTTTIKFLCKIGDLQSPPELESKSWNGCEYVFTWKTAAACRLHVISGVGCTLEDTVTGNVYDLTPLAAGGAFYNITKGGFKYNIKVCSKNGLDKSICGNKVSVGVCQKSLKKDGKVLNAGQVHDNLYYYDGVLKMKFVGGDQCSLKTKPNRMSYITFFCDENAGRGNPVFIRETYCTYYFAWYTKYACPLKSIECIVKNDEGNVYDLSPLVKTKNNWLVISKDGQTQYFINVCRVLHRNKAVTECPAESAVCQIKANKKATNIGSLVSPLTVTPKGLPVLQYQSSKYGSIITFICDKRGKVGKPELDSSDNNLFSFTWHTKYACAVKPKVENGCDDDVTRLSVLRTTDRTGYKITIPNTKDTVHLDICQNVKSCGSRKPSTACLVKDGKITSLGRSDKSYIEHDLDVTTLTYPGGDKFETKQYVAYYKTKINFICTPNITRGSPVFLKKAGYVYYFEFDTSAICNFDDVECVVHDGKDIYDLSPLKLPNGNWMAEDTRSHLDYYINVCSSYSPANVQPKCSANAGIGGCQIDTKSSKSHDMGHVGSRPSVSSEGHLTLRYIGGEKCHQGKYFRSTRMNFFCSDVHGSPVYMAETASCEYLFNWKTPAACPLKYFQGAHCQVYDENYDFNFDLTSLTEHKNITIEKNLKYRGKFCGEKSFSCSLQGQSSTVSFNFESLQYYNGKILFNYTSASGASELVNEISCDITEEKVKYKGYTQNGKNYRLLWGSKLACPPVTGEECSITRDGALYDLTVLAKEKWNWIARNDLKNLDFQDSQFYFSVCKSLKRIPGLSRKGSRAAMVNDKGKVTSLGTMIKPLNISNGYLTMVYGHGDVFHHCKNLQTTIQFVCDDVVPEGVGLGPIVDGFDVGACALHVTWLTRAACKVRSLDAPPANLPPCAAIHPATRKVIDLRVLNNTKGYPMNQYKINICGVVEGCPGNSSICKNDKSKKPTSLGNVNTQLQYRQGFLFLHYTNGDMCVAELGRKMETMITFICDSSAGRGSPVIEKTDECTHFVTWKTNLACEAEVDCVAHDGQTFYDLTPLVRNNANYELYYGKRRFIINVCRSLVQGSGCPANAAVCQTGSRKSLGKVSGPPWITKEGNVRLNYTDGSCTTTITFICNQLLNEQVITQVEGCDVSISWSTALVCARPYTNNNCIFMGPKGDYCFDLRNLGWSESITATIPGGSLIHFSQCGKRIKKCGKVDERPFEACLKMAGKNATSLTRKGISYNGSEVRIDYDDAVLVLYCGENQNSNTPLYIGQYEETSQPKRYLFSLITPAVCPPRQFACEVKHGKKTYNLNGLGDHEPFSVRDGDTEYLVSICGHVRFTPKTGVCSSRATTVRIKDGGEPEIITVDNNYNLTYQESEEYPIRLVYNGSQSIDLCGGKVPSVVHKFKCAGIMSPPSFSGFDKTNCQFTFSWQTNEACAEQRSALRKTGDWRFSDKKAVNCELDLYFLKKEIPKCKEIINLQLFAHDDEYELVVNCTSKIIVVNLQCGNDTKLKEITTGRQRHLTFVRVTTRVCDFSRSSTCSQTLSRSVAKSAAAVIGTLAGIGLLAAILFVACKPDRRQTTALWLKWHVRKYICCKPSYRASYRYKRVKTDEVDGETDFIEEIGGGSLFSDGSDDDYDSGSNENDDDDLLPLDDDLLNLEE